MDCVIGVCTEPGSGGHNAAWIGPDGIDLEERGKGANTRFISNIAMVGRNVVGNRVVTEVFTPDGNWSSYPPHRNDEDDYPRMTYLEETYYHRLKPASGYGIQRVFTEDGSLDETIAVSGHRCRSRSQGSPPVRRPVWPRDVLSQRHGRAVAEVAVPEPPRP